MHRAITILAALITALCCACGQGSVADSPMPPAGVVRLVIAQQSGSCRPATAATAGAGVTSVGVDFGSYDQLRNAQIGRVLCQAGHRWIVTSTETVTKRRDSQVLPTMQTIWASDGRLLLVVDVAPAAT